MNNSTPLSNLCVTKDDFLRSGWEQVLSSSTERECWSYSSLFREKSKEAEKAGDAKKGQVFALLSHVTSMILKPDAKYLPFAPWAELQNSRSAIIDDFTEDHLAFFKEIVNEISDGELRARIADIVWVRKRDIRMAEIAVDSYLESARVLEHPEKWTLAMDRIERGLRLSAQIGKTGSRFQTVISFMEHLLEQFNGEDPLFFSAKLMELFQEYHRDEPSKYARLAEKAATRAEGTGNWYLARNYWQINAKWHQLGKEEELQRIALIRLAETYVQEAESVRERPGQGYMIASHHIQSAIQALGRVSGTKERRDELHRILLDYEKKSAGELKVISVDVDLSKVAENAMKHVKGFGLHDALLRFAFLGSPKKVKDLEIEIEQHAKKYPLQHLIPSVAVNNAGKVVARKPSMLSNSTEEIDAAKYAEMYGLAASHRSMLAFSVIEPARRQINLEHNIRLSDLLEISSNNPFVPPGHELILANGLYLGMTGDFLVSSHLLVPQLENSLRYVLNQTGVPTSGINDQGIQDEFLLDRILFMPELGRVLGEDLVFELRGLLVERHGSNFRNLLAHGLLDQDAFYSGESIYLWWLTLHLCCIPISSRMKESENVPEEEK